jgi:hypothetical protein
LQILFLTLLSAGNLFCAGEVNPSATAERRREPVIIELEDPSEIEQSNLFFPRAVYKELEINREEYRESPFRRAEIIFFISLPYSYMYNLFITQFIMDSKRGGHQGLNKWHYVYILVSSMVLSAFISYDDNNFVYSTPLERENTKRENEIRIDFEFFRYRF